MRAVLIGIAFIAVLLYSRATLGIDMSYWQGGATFNNWKCLNQSGYSFAIVQAWCGGYNWNPKVGQQVSNAWAAGFHHVDLYIFMCPQCHGNADPVAVINTIFTNSRNIQHGMVWIDIEQCQGCWHGDLSQNVAYIEKAVERAKQLWGQSKVGMYASRYEWGITFGESVRSFSNLPLWYAHYDANPSFSDSYYYQFGGWSHPAIKQYNDKGPNCGVPVDVDYY